MIIFNDIIKKNLPHGIVQPRRSQIYVGFRCHQKCGFCYYKHRCNDQMFDFEFIRKQIDFKYKYGIRDFEITGGEPSEHTQLREICQYIKSLNKNSKIAIITNGSLHLSNIWDVIDEVLVSYHLSKNCESYDHAIFPYGCTFDKVKRTIDLAKSNGILVRTNTVIGMFNIDDINLVNDLIELQPSIINFLPLNLFDDAKTMSNYIDYDRFGEMMDIFIPKIQQFLPNSLIFIRYVPFCVVEKYAKFVVGHVQHIYDWFDWNRELDGIEYLQLLKNDQHIDMLNKLGEYGSTSLQSAINDRNSLYIKNSKCMRCKYQIICDGIDKTLNSNNNLNKYIKPIPGQIVKNCLEYSKDVSYKYYHKLYGNRS